MPGDDRQGGTGQTSDEALLRLAAEGQLSAFDALVRRWQDRLLGYAWRMLGDRHVENVRCLTDGCRRVEKTTTVTRADGKVHQFHESVRMYSRQEMVEMLRAVGFAEVVCYGSLDGGTCSESSPRLILIAEKGAPCS